MPAGALKQVPKTGTGQQVLPGPATQITDPTKNQTKPPAGTKPPYNSGTGGNCKCNAPLLKNQQLILNQMGTGAPSPAPDSSDILSRLTRIEANQKNPVTGFAALQTGQVGILGLLQSVNSFMRTAWEKSRINKVLNALMFVGVMHNVLMLSRDVGETFGYLAGNMLNAIGIEDEEGNSLDVVGWFGSTVEGIMRNFMGDDLYEGTREAWNKASSVLRAASMVIWTVRSIMDSSLDLMEWIGENTGKIGNALRAYGVVGDRAYRYMAERAQVRNRLRTRVSRITGGLENAEDVASSFEQATGNVLEIQQETGELIQNSQAFWETTREAVPDPWFDNEPVRVAQDAAIAASQSPDITAADADKP
jgi:hypothetical protein